MLENLIKKYLETRYNGENTEAVLKDYCITYITGLDIKAIAVKYFVDHLNDAYDYTAMDIVTMEQLIPYCDTTTDRDEILHKINYELSWHESKLID